MDQRIVVALSKYDVLEATGCTLDYKLLGQMMGVPMVPVVSYNDRGIAQLLDTIVDVYEGKESSVKHIHINQGIAEQSVNVVAKALKEHREQLPKPFPPRYYATKLLEGDTQIISMLQQAPQFKNWMVVVRKEQDHLHYDLGSSESIENTFANQKYGYIAGALRQTLTRPQSRRDLTKHIDEVVTHRIWGYPIFFIAMWAMFYCTFSLGEYPQQWIESGVQLLSRFIDGIMPAGVLKDLILDGVIGGVGSVIVFLPNIMILYLFIAYMEDSGYLSRAAFIMDKLMHKVGLHGKSFIPLVMGFGCNVPAVMATKSIESRSSRIITALILPFISCSARLPVYILFLGCFFGSNSGTILFGLYLLGIVVAMVTSLLMRKFCFSADETPFVMELTPYRLPTLRATLSHMWSRCAEYIKNLSGVILAASVIIWALSYFPRSDEQMSQQQHFEYSYIGRLGKACEPVFEPLGLNRKSSVALISGVAAKEVVVSTIGVLYNGDSEDEDGQNLHLRLVNSGDFSKASVLALLVFTLLYFPCIATLATIASEYGKRWAIASAVYSTAVAWVLAFLVYHIVQLI
jgi:ferrous iron transport protein B